MKPSEQQRLNTFAAQYNKITADTQVVVANLSVVKNELIFTLDQLDNAEVKLDKTVNQQLAVDRNIQKSKLDLIQKETSLQQREVLFEEEQSRNRDAMDLYEEKYRKNTSSYIRASEELEHTISVRSNDLVEIEDKIDSADSNLTVVSEMLDATVVQFKAVESNLSSAVDSHDTFVEEAAKERKNVEIELAKVYLELHTAVESLANPIAALEARSSDLDKRDKAMQIREARFRNAMAEYFPNVTT